jgi:hypothetical protein
MTDLLPLQSWLGLAIFAVFLLTGAVVYLAWWLVERERKRRGL